MAKSIWLIMLIALAFASGCKSSNDKGALTLATTTSTQDTGLLDVLVPKFEQQTGIKIKVVAVGSGQALELGRRGDADVLLTHSPEAEKKFMDDGFGAQRHAVMHNDFVLVGPGDNPAGIKGQTSAVDAFRTLSGRNVSFVSRGDESGTHQKEKAIWKAAGVEPEGQWYVSAGTGMAQALRMANEKRAYILTDRGTYLALLKEIDLIVLVEGDSTLTNPYTVIVVNSQKHPHVNHDAAERFAKFLVSAECQAEIARFGIDKFGQALFFPAAPHTQ